jgi:hypothetical protein
MVDEMVSHQWLIHWVCIWLHVFKQHFYH